jgi:hypothetical protein
LSDRQNPANTAFAQILIPPKVPARLAGAVRRWVIEGPAEQGLDRANETHAELADHRFKANGGSASRSDMPRFGHNAGLRPYRPTERSLRGDPVEPAEDLARSAKPTDLPDLLDDYLQLSGTDSAS